jgi:hypothetical protein
MGDKPCSNTIAPVSPQRDDPDAIAIEEEIDLIADAQASPSSDIRGNGDPALVVMRMTVGPQGHRV